MTTQRVTGASGDVQLTTMSTKATAFTIDELLRPELHVSGNRRHDGAVVHQRNTPYSGTKDDDDELDLSLDSRTSCRRSCSRLRVGCHLETRGLWQAFNQLGLTEMIVTKSGRRMFPPLRVRLSGMEDDDDANCSYDVMLDVLPVDNRRYRYAYHRSSWVISERTSADGAEAPARAAPVRSYRHPDGPFPASQLLQRAVSFDRVKLTNNRSINKNGYIVVDSMRKYCPRVRLVRRAAFHLGSPGESPDAEPTTRSFLLSECVFITVTAYQNQLMTKLKIDSNPFAKGFRDICRFSGLSVIRRSEKQTAVGCKCLGAVGVLNSGSGSRPSALNYELKTTKQLSHQQS